MKYLALAALLLGGCATNPPDGAQLTLPSTAQIVPDPEPHPTVNPGDDLGVSLLKTDAALTRANTKLTNAATNYTNLRARLIAGKRKVK